MSDSVRPHRWQPTRLPRPWDSPGKNTGVGCHFLLQCMKVKSEREVAQSSLTLRDPMDCSLPGSSIHGVFQARVLEWGAITFSKKNSYSTIFQKYPNYHWSSLLSYKFKDHFIEFHEKFSYLQINLGGTATSLILTFPILGPSVFLHLFGSSLIYTKILPVNLEYFYYF